MKEVFDKNGYEYKPYNGPSGRSRYFKYIRKGVIFYFPIGNGFFYLSIRVVKTKYLEDLFDNVVHESILGKEYLLETEQYAQQNAA